jgi:hypothetical protein
VSGTPPYPSGKSSECPRIHSETTGIFTYPSGNHRIWSTFVRNLDFQALMRVVLRWYDFLRFLIRLPLSYFNRRTF